MVVWKIITFLFPFYEFGFTLHSWRVWGRMKQLEWTVINSTLLGKKKKRFSFLSFHFCFSLFLLILLYFPCVCNGWWISTRFSTKKEHSIGLELPKPRHFSRFVIILVYSHLFLIVAFWYDLCTIGSTINWQECNSTGQQHSNWWSYSIIFLLWRLRCFNHVI